jgi:KilA-N domain
MADIDFTLLLKESELNRPDHVPIEYVRVDHWQPVFNAQFHHYEQNAETKRYWNAVREKLSRDSAIAQKMIFKPGQKHKGTGTWMHPLIAAHYAAWLDADFAVLVNETFIRVVEGDSDLAAEMMIRDYNKDRQQKALKRVKATVSNRTVNGLSQKHGLPFYKIHDDRNVGLYGRTTKQLRADGGIEGKETPLNYMSDLDLSYADAANGMVIEADNPSLMALAASGIADLHKKITGKSLQPKWESDRLTPTQARTIAHSAFYQAELPL